MQRRDPGPWVRYERAERAPPPWSENPGGVVPEPGDRIELAAPMENDPQPIELGEQGTVTFVQLVKEQHSDGGWTQVGVEWDSGRSLMLSIPPDKIRIVRQNPFFSPPALQYPAMARRHGIERVQNPFFSPPALQYPAMVRRHGIERVSNPEPKPFQVYVDGTYAGIVAAKSARDAKKRAAAQHGVKQSQVKIKRYEADRAQDVLFGYDPDEEAAQRAIEDETGQGTMFNPRRRNTPR